MGNGGFLQGERSFGEPGNKKKALLTRGAAVSPRAEMWCVLRNRSNPAWGSSGRNNKKCVSGLGSDQTWGSRSGILPLFGKVMGATDEC